MAACTKCGRVSEEIADVLSICVDCLREADDDSLAFLRKTHARSREEFGLPALPPRNVDGVQCALCQNECRIPAASRGYCGVRRNEGGCLRGGTAQEAAVSWYYDPLPTNCVADWVCAGGSAAGHPRWSHAPRAEHGYVSLAVFYEACTFNCMFCQNWHYRERSTKDAARTAQQLAESVTANTSCICFFGGDPTCQLPHALAASRLARRQSRQRILRICWETNGSMSPKLLNKIMDLSLESGGCVKFDLKAMNRNIHLALCGVDNRRTLENFAAAAKRIPQRPEPPPLVASTLLVPGYIDAKEVSAIASFIADLDPNIPYALLGFHGDFLMTDLPRTSRKHAQSCLAAAEAAGLKRVRLGNIHILR
ncbi:MAG TPA: radical SAM protein [Sedimentisphaerales bacterium]|nr:radical SAM protein [Sedimentisphaerales bacterium]